MPDWRDSCWLLRCHQKIEKIKIYISDGDTLCGDWLMTKYAECALHGISRAQNAHVVVQLLVFLIDYSTVPGCKLAIRSERELQSSQMVVAWKGCARGDHPQEQPANIHCNSNSDHRTLEPLNSPPHCPLFANWSFLVFLSPLFDVWRHLPV